MIILLDGPDGSGKTTLANKLAKMAGGYVTHCTQPKPEDGNMFEMYERILNAHKDSVPKDHRVIILDRCWYSEMVYGPIMRGKSDISYPEMFALEAIVARRGGILIHCTDTPETLWCRCTTRGEDYIKDYGTFTEICKSFDTLMKVPHLIPVFKYDYRDY